MVFSIDPKDIFLLKNRSTPIRWNLPMIENKKLVTHKLEKQETIKYGSFSCKGRILGNEKCNIWADLIKILFVKNWHTGFDSSLLWHFFFLISNQANIHIASNSVFSWQEKLCWSRLLFHSFTNRVEGNCYFIFWWIRPNWLISVSKPSKRSLWFYLWQVILLISNLRF